MYPLTRNAISDYHRSAVHGREVATDAVPDVLTIGLLDDDDDAALREFAFCLRPMLTRLPEGQAAAARMIDLDDLAQASAARGVGITLSVMKSRVQRGRAADSTPPSSVCSQTGGTAAGPAIPPSTCWSPPIRRPTTEPEFQHRRRSKREGEFVSGRSPSRGAELLLTAPGAVMEKGYPHKTDSVQHEDATRDGEDRPSR